MNAQDQLEKELEQQAAKEAEGKKEEPKVEIPKVEPTVEPSYDDGPDYNQAPPKEKVDPKDLAVSTLIGERVNKIISIGESSDKIKLAPWQWNLIVLRHFSLPFEDVIEFAYNIVKLGANPFLKQIYLQERYVKREKRYRGTMIISYHFMGAVANSTGEYDGCEVKFEKRSLFDPVKRADFEDLVCLVTIHRKGRQAFPVEVLFSEYFDKEAFMWRSKPYTMIRKVGMAIGFRMTFPEILSGVYIAEEMKQGDAPDKPENETLKNKIEQTRIDAPPPVASMIGGKVE